MLEALGNILTGVGSFISSILDTVHYLTTFIAQCVTECAELLAVIPAFVATVIVSGLTFSVILACKRGILG